MNATPESEYRSYRGRLAFERNRARRSSPSCVDRSHLNGVVRQRDCETALSACGQVVRVEQRDQLDAHPLHALVDERPYRIDQLAARSHQGMESVELGPKPVGTAAHRTVIAARTGLIRHRLRIESAPTHRGLRAHRNQPALAEFDHHSGSSTAVADAAPRR
jgi:hypothetical protein